MMSWMMSYIKGQEKVMSHLRWCHRSKARKKWCPILFSAHTEPQIAFRGGGLCSASASHFLVYILYISLWIVSSNKEFNTPFARQNEVYYRQERLVMNVVWLYSYTGILFHDLHCISTNYHVIICFKQMHRVHCSVQKNISLGDGDRKKILSQHVFVPLWYSKITG